MVVISFICGWIAGIIGTLWFGRWLSEREIREVMKDHDERTSNDS